MTYKYFVECDNYKCKTFRERMSEKVKCPQCGEKLSMYPMVGFGGLDIVFNNQRFWLSNPRATSSNSGTEIDRADVAESLEFMNFCWKMQGLLDKEYATDRRLN